MIVNYSFLPGFSALYRFARASKYGFFVLIMLILTGTALIMTCSETPVELTGGSGTETVGIVGQVLDSNDLPVPGAIIRLRRADFLDTATQGLAKRVLYLADAVTDDTGGYYLSSVDTGVYLIAATDQQRGVAAHYCTVLDPDTLITVPAVTLKLAGEISGNLVAYTQVDSVRVDLFVYGLSGRYSTIVGGSFRAGTIPEGSFRVAMIPASRVVERLDTVAVIESGKETGMGELNLPHHAQRIDPDDSIVVRLFLDSNSLTSTSVGDVVETYDFWPFRVKKLEVVNSTLTTMAARVGSLTYLQVLVLAGNQLTHIPVSIGNLHHLRELLLNGNRIESLPASTRFLDSLEVLNIANNALSFLPQEIGQLKVLHTLDAGYNHLVMVPPALGYCSSMQVLILEGNMLDSLPHELTYLRELNYLNIGSNSFQKIPFRYPGDSLSPPPFPPHMVVNLNENRLCEPLPPEDRAWMDVHGNDSLWESKQRCN